MYLYPVCTRAYLSADGLHALNLAIRDFSARDTFHTLLVDMDHAFWACTHVNLSVTVRLCADLDVP